MVSDDPFDFQWLDDSSYHAYAGYGPISDGVPEHIDDDDKTEARS